MRDARNNCCWRWSTREGGERGQATTERTTFSYVAPEASRGSSNVRMARRRNTNNNRKKNKYCNAISVLNLNVLFIIITGKCSIYLWINIFFSRYGIVELVAVVGTAEEEQTRRIHWQYYIFFAFLSLFEIQEDLQWFDVFRSTSAKNTINDYAEIASDDALNNEKNEKNNVIPKYIRRKWTEFMTFNHIAQNRGVYYCNKCKCYHTGGCSESIPLHSIFREIDFV